MIPNNNLSVLPWYTDIEDQNHRRSYAYGAVFPLFVPNNTLIPFQILRSTRADAIKSLRIFYRNGTLWKDVSSVIANSGITVKRFQNLGYDAIVFQGILPLNLNMPEGQMYAVLSDGIENWYSEIFTVVNTAKGYLKIEWYDDEDLTFDAGTIVYKNPNFRNVVYLCTELGKPDYEFTEDGEDRDGSFFPEKQISEKTYRFIFMAPEYLCDVMRLIRLSDHVFVTSRGKTYECDTFLITPKWEVQGDLASVETEFQCATVVKKIGRGYIVPTGGDYNNDFNKDFNIE